jgi:hypothetical protein
MVEAHLAPGLRQVRHATAKRRAPRQVAMHCIPPNWLSATAHVLLAVGAEAIGRRARLSTHAGAAAVLHAALVAIEHGALGSKCAPLRHVRSCDTVREVHS